MAKFDVPITFRAVDKVGDGVKSVGASIGGLLATLGKVGAVAGVVGTALASLGAGAALAAVTRDAIALDTQLQRVALASGAGAEGFDRLKQAALAASSDSGRSVEEVASALEALARDGFSAEEAISALNPALAMARINGTSATESVQQLGAVVGGFGLAATDAAKAADLIAGGALRGGTSVNDFARALQTLGPAASGAGLGIEDAAAAVALLGTREIDGTRAARALTQVFDQLGDPASAFSKQLDALGIQTRDFGEVIVELGKRGSEAEPALAAFGANTTNALRVLLADGGAALAGVRADLENTAGVAARTAEQLNTNFGEQLAQLGQTVRNAFVDLIDVSPLQDELGDLLTTIRGVADSPAWDRIGKAFSDILAAIGDLGRALVEDADVEQWAENVAFVMENVALPAVQGLVPIFEMIGDAARTVGNVLQTAFQGIRVTILSAAKVAVEFERLLARLPGVSEEYRQSVALVAETIDEQLNTATQTLRAELVDVVDSVLDFAGAQNEAVAAADRTANETIRATKAITEQGAAAEQTADSLGELAEKLEATAAAASKLAVIKPIPQAEQDFLAAATAADRLTQAQKDLETVNKGTADSTRQAAAAASDKAVASQEAADSSRDAAAAGAEQSDSMNNLTLALFETSEKGLRAYMDANRAAIVSAREFARRVNDVTARIREQELAARQAADALRRQTDSGSELDQILERLRGQYDLLSDAQLRDLANAELQIRQQQRAAGAERARFQEVAAARADAEIEADNRVAANRRRIAEESVARTESQVQTPVPGTGSTVINVTVTGLIGGDRVEFIRQLARELEVEFRRLGLLAR